MTFGRREVEVSPCRNQRGWNHISQYSANWIGMLSAKAKNEEGFRPCSIEANRTISGSALRGLLGVRDHTQVSCTHKMSASMRSTLLGPRFVVFFPPGIASCYLLLLPHFTYHHYDEILNEIQVKLIEMDSVIPNRIWLHLTCSRKAETSRLATQEHTAIWRCFQRREYFSRYRIKKSI